MTALVTPLAAKLALWSLPVSTAWVSAPTERASLASFQMSGRRVQADTRCLADLP